MDESDPVSKSINDNNNNIINLKENMAKMNKKLDLSIEQNTNWNERDNYGYEKENN